MDVERTIAGPFYYPSGYRRLAEVPCAVHWEPSSGRLSLVLWPFRADGSFTNITNPRFQWADSEKEAKELAAELLSGL
jgi:hypothetical protein